MDNLTELYNSECKKSLKIVYDALEKIKDGTHNEETFKQLRQGAHAIRGTSLQMGHYSVGYLANNLENVAMGLMEKRLKIEPKIVLFIVDFVKSLEKTIATVIKTGEATIDEKLLKKLDSVLAK